MAATVCDDGRPMLAFVHTDDEIAWLIHGLGWNFQKPGVMPERLRLHEVDATLAVCWICAWLRRIRTWCESYTKNGCVAAFQLDAGACRAWLPMTAYFADLPLDRPMVPMIPMARFAAVVHEGKNKDAVGFGHIQHTISKHVCQTPPHLAIYCAPPRRMGFCAWRMRYSRAFPRTGC